MPVAQQRQSASTQWKAKAIRVGLIGKGIQLSRTPEMHMAEGAAKGIDYQYDLIDPEVMTGAAPSLAEMLDKAEAQGFAGCNVTYPYKIEALNLVDSLSDPARLVGAINTVVFKDGKRSGHNTDYWGFAEGLRTGLPDAKLETVLLLGAGGAGGAVAHALRSLGVKTLMIFDTSLKSATALAQACGGKVVTDIAQAAAEADGIVNATPMGMAKLPGTAIDTSLLAARHWVSDIVYFPLETALLREARAKGCATLNGSGMAVFQAVRAFTLFSGNTPNVARMRATFEAFDT